jgi:hypothetical protein
MMDEKFGPEQIGSEQRFASALLASDTGKKLVCRTYYRGFGDNKTVFVVIHNNYKDERPFEQHDAAVNFYNSLP